MRLLSFTLPLLLLVSSSLGAPTSPNDPAPSMCPCDDGVEGSGLAVEDTVPAKDTVTETDEEVTVPAPTPQTTIEIIVENVTRTIVHEVTEPATETTVAPCACAVAVTTPKPCACEPAPTEAPTANPCCCCNNPASDVVGTVPEVVPVAEEIFEETRTCNCEESDACRKESLSTMDACMEECNEHLEVYGDKTEAYRGCFSKNNASIIEAENCLFKDTKCKDTKNVEDPTDWDSLSDIAYESKANETIANNYLWKRDEAKYNNIQTFFHCTKHCMHKKVQECTSEKKCTIQMPEREDFAAKMRQCTKDNFKISQSIFAACQCLAWKNDVKELRGSCVVIGNKFFIDRA